MSALRGCLAPRRRASAAAALAVGVLAALLLSACPRDDAGRGAETPAAAAAPSPPRDVGVEAEAALAEASLEDLHAIERLELLEVLEEFDSLAGAQSVAARHELRAFLKPLPLEAQGRAVGALLRMQPALHQRAMRRFAELDPVEREALRERLLAGADGFAELAEGGPVLSAEERERLARALPSPAEERAQALTRLRALPPAERERLARSAARWRSLPEAQRELLRGRLRHLRSLPDAQRRELLEWYSDLVPPHLREG